MEPVPAKIRQAAVQDPFDRLPSLSNVGKYAQIITRFAPNPDFVIHLGSIRAVILSHDYARKYKGKFILRFEDTDPRLKKSTLPYYDLVREDVRWLECAWDEEYIQSDRVPIYYEHAAKIISLGQAYVCTCEPETFRTTIESGQECPCRSKSVETNLEEWNKMLTGAFQEGQAVVRIKTDVQHPNPAIRDWPALRIIDPEKYPHPRVGSKYRVWPLYNFSAAIDDHLLSITHIIRGKEHLTNALRQTYLYKHFGWIYPETVEYGRIRTTDIKLSKSLMVKQVSEGVVSGYSDPRLPTLAALRRRGYAPAALRKIVYEIGPRAVDATLSWENINATNRKEIDKIAHRYNFIANPVTMTVKDVPGRFEAHLPVHPDNPSLGTRDFVLDPINGITRLMIARQDLEVLRKSKMVRLMELFNVEIGEANERGVEAKFQSKNYLEARKHKAPLINWLPEVQNIPCEVVMPDASRVTGPVEKNIMREETGTIIQMVRFGFGRIDSKENSNVSIYYGHR
ncbi:MAG TPA: glutamate--tRNA ligase [Candidatus Bathyarchaeia archaeon]|nr:glutamate--tRNA ligase [Candidatus Bathyarchaeia archaeon]